MQVWFNGRTRPSQGCNGGSIPLTCSIFLFFRLFLFFILAINYTLGVGVGQLFQFYVIGIGDRSQDIEVHVYTVAFAMQSDISSQTIDVDLDRNFINIALPGSRKRFSYVSVFDVVESSQAICDQKDIQIDQRHADVERKIGVEVIEIFPVVYDHDIIEIDQ